ncbi:hypothetical protein C7S14_1741 [Burkholderia cepacia]|nr:hypothetical protein C7S14_1741 [Burkholderia cepacia]
MVNVFLTDKSRPMQAMISEEETGDAACEAAGGGRESG